MVRFTGAFALFTALALAAQPGHRATQEEQQVLGIVPTRQGNPRKLKGRFLHITDFHPDPFYKLGADPEGEHPCHKGKGGSIVGHYGAATTDCDSPFALVNATFDWMRANIKDEIDFIIWTGDSARHDNDDDYPRSVKQIEDLNAYIVSKFVETFGKPDNINDPDPTNDFVVPIVPTYGNNDILPHNIFEPGPNRWTKRYLEIWASFVPEEQRHSFARGGWFFTEVIPNKLAVISLNTLYFFSSNAAVDGCDLESEPGYEHMEWLRIQLQFMRERNMKAILIGHVPPARTESKQNWDETCHQKYTLWQRQYRDVIVANIFGHMNIDHFMFQDVRDLAYKFKIDGVDNEGLRPNDYNPNPVPNDEFHAAAKAAYINELRDGWAHLPEPPKGLRYSDFTSKSPKHGGKGSHKEREKFLKEIGGEWAERFTISYVSPSIVPNFFPTLRIIDYNMTGLEHDHPAQGRPQGTPAEVDDILARREMEEDNDGNESVDMHVEDPDSKIEANKKKKHKKKKGRKGKPTQPDFPVPLPPSKTSLPGPAYSPQTFSFTSWVQLYANLTKINAKVSSKSAKSASQVDLDDSAYDFDLASNDEPKWLQSARERAVADKHDKYFDFRVEYTTYNDSTYKMNDLTVRSWLDLAERIGRTEYEKSDEGMDNAGESVVDAGLSVDDDNNEDNDNHDDDDDQTLSELYPGDVTRSENGHQEAHTDKKRKKKGKGKGKKRKDSGSGRLKKNRLWHTFVKRVFVQTKSEKDLEDDFD